MSQWTIYHNPRCSKSRETLELLRKRGVEPVMVEYLKTPPSAAELERIVRKLGIPAAKLVRTKEPDFGKLRIDLSDDAQVIRALAAHPILIERPIVVKDDKAVLGRPPQNVEALL